MSVEEDKQFAVIKTQITRSIVAHLFIFTFHIKKLLRYKPEGRGFDSRWCHWNFSSTQFLPAVLWPSQPLTEMSTRNISWGGECGRCVSLTTLPPSFADCLEIWEPQPPGTLRDCKACNGIALPFYLTVKVTFYLTLLIGSGHQTDRTAPLPSSIMLQRIVF